MKYTALLALLLLLPAPGDDPVIARATGQEFLRADYAEWLVKRYGVHYAQEFVVDQLVLRMAEERGLLPTDEAVEQAYTKEFNQIVATIFKNEPEGYLQDVEIRGYTPESFKAKRMREIRSDLAQGNIARADRSVSEAQLRDRYRTEYGDLGELTVVEAYFFSAFRGLSPLDPDPDIAALKAAARTRADAARVALAGGAPRSEVLATSDAIASEFWQDGLISGYRRDMLGKEVDRALSSLDEPGETSPVVDTFDGNYVLRLVSREPVRFEDVREELEQHILNDPIAGDEYARVRALVLDTYDAEVLLR